MCDKMRASVYTFFFIRLTAVRDLRFRVNGRFSFKYVLNLSIFFLRSPFNKLFIVYDLNLVFFYFHLLFLVWTTQ